MIKIDEIQEFLKQEELDGWLMADFHARNEIMVEFLGLSEHLTRRTFFFIPAEGQPIALVHNIERDRFKHLDYKKINYSSYRVLEEKLHDLLSNVFKVAMEYSHNGRLPYIGLVDAGTIELVKSCKVDIVSSANMVSYFRARMSPEQVVTHREAAMLINQIKDDAFQLIGDSIKSAKTITEFDVVQYILDRFTQAELVCDFPPCCAIDANISNPHYQPDEKESLSINEGSLILIDLWAKKKSKSAVYADITWMAYAGDKVPEKYSEIFSVAAAARDRAVEFINEKFKEGTVNGYEVDDACREVIEQAGHGEYFFHRTGHSILESVHGPGPNIDNLETEDRRKLLPGHLFSIEPGIYLPEYGVRTEIDCMLTEEGPKVTTQPMQQEIIALL